MNDSIVHSSGPVLLLGGGEMTPEAVAPLVPRADFMVAADGGARHFASLGLRPDAVIGDMDSALPDDLAGLPDSAIHHIPEQDSTDFDKCLRNIRAPLVWGAGFLGARIDHQLAAMNVLVRHAHRRCMLIGPQDVIALAPPRLDLHVPVGTRLSLFPFARVRGTATGLRWPLEGLDFAPDARVGTSNETTAPIVHLRVEAPSMLVILPVSALDRLEAALLSPNAQWPVRE